VNAIFDDSLGLERTAPSQYTSNVDEEAELVFRFDQAVHGSTTEAMLALDAAARACGAAMRAGERFRAKWQADDRWGSWERFVAGGGRSLTESRLVVLARLG
jgi:predicted DsbA family dithiol-disulfide isomerase